jgi:ParB family transcriptional regulator, chromosome partitioning protein
MSKKRGLGKGLGELGLGELLGDIQTQLNEAAAVTKPKGRVELSMAAERAATPAPGLQLRRVDVDLLQAGRYQPRKNFLPETLQELADSIKAQGIIQPLVVRPLGDNQYEIIAGERRWRAAQLAGLSDVPVIIRDLPDEAAIAMSLIENIQRRDLNVIEESTALNRLIIEFQMTHQEVAEAVGKSRTVVTNLLRLQKLNPDVRALVEKNFLDMGHARALLALEGAEQSKVANIIYKRALSVRQTEQLIRKLGQSKSNKSGKAPVDPDILSLQQRLSEKLGAEVSIQHTAKGKGKLTINYHSVDELDGILAGLNLDA